MKNNKFSKGQKFTPLKDKHIKALIARTLAKVTREQTRCLLEYNYKLSKKLYDIECLIEIMGRQMARQLKKDKEEGR